MKPQSVSELSAFVKREALSAGFALAGITGPQPPPHLDVFQAWLGSDRHGQMGYMSGERARAARADPRLLLPEVRSILVVAADYTPSDDGPPKPDKPGVAAYARGDDYHDVLKRRLTQVVHRLEDHLGSPFPHRIYVDTGPILERELAQRAGLGWIGKNTCLINPESGSYLLLAELLLGLDLAPDVPFSPDRCGSCTRCIDACPTHCILPDRTLDASRCISYITIELRGAVPEPLRGETGGWVFGCDVCQQVCPWNGRFAQPSEDPAFQTRPFLRQATLHSLLVLDRADYVAGLRRSPLKRAKLGGLKRNASLAAARQGATEYAPDLAQALNNSDPNVRLHAAWALGRIGGQTAQESLEARRAVEDHPDVDRAISQALAGISKR